MSDKRKKAAEAVKAMQEHAKRHGLDRLTDAEIQQEIDEARKARKKPDPEPPAEKKLVFAKLTPHDDCDCLSCRPWTS